jgi:hypothetical protein
MEALSLPELTLAIGSLFLFWKTIRVLLKQIEKAVLSISSIADKRLTNFEVRDEAEIAVDNSDFIESLQGKSMTSTNELKDLISRMKTDDQSEPANE